MALLPFARRAACFAVVLGGMLGGTAASAQIQTAVEYHHAGWDHYFITSFADEIAALDGGAFGGVWQRTGQTFSVWGNPADGTLPTCRFFSTAFAPRSSHFYTPFPDECATVRNNPSWQYESIAFHIAPAYAGGSCPSGTVPLYRAYNNGRGGAPNHRYTTSEATLDQVIAAGWVFEGNGDGRVFACVPPPTTIASCAGQAAGEKDEVAENGATKFSIFPLWVTTDVVVADVDGDGRADVLTLAQYSTSSSEQEGRLNVYRQTASGTFCAAETYVVGGYPWRMVVADVDGDGAPDVVIADVTRSQLPALPHAPWMLRQDAARRGIFLAPQRLASGGSGLSTVAIADVNGDGAPDIVVDDGLGTGGAAAALFQDPDHRGAFRAPAPIALPGTPEYIVAGDANGDHRPDVAFWVVTSYVDYTATGSMAMLRQSASGELLGPDLSLRITGRNVQRMAMTDYDADGLRDVVLFQYPQSTDYKGVLVTALQQPPNVYTGVETSLEGVDGIDDAAIADLDGDGRPDVAVAGWWFHQGDVRQTRGRVNVFTQSGAGRFVQRAQYDVDLTVSRIAAGDIDADGRQDLVLLGGDNEVYLMVQSKTVRGAFEPARPLR